MYDSNNIKKLLGKRLKELRQKAHLSQEALAERLNIDQRNLSKIECGNNFITAETLSKIVAALNIEPYELFNFNHHKDETLLREELLNVINNNQTNIKLIYQIYQAIK